MKALASAALLSVLLLAGCATTYQPAGGYTQGCPGRATGEAHYDAQGNFDYRECEPIFEVAPVFSLGLADNNGVHPLQMISTHPSMAKHNMTTKELRECWRDAICVRAFNTFVSGTGLTMKQIGTRPSAGDEQVAAPPAYVPPAACAPGYNFFTFLDGRPAGCFQVNPPKVAAAPPARTYTPVEEPTGVIRYTPGRPIIALVKLNGRTTARLILHTGADASMVRPDLLRAAGIDLSRPAGRAEMQGVVPGKTVEVPLFPVTFVPSDGQVGEVLQ